MTGIRAAPRDTPMRRAAFASALLVVFAGGVSAAQAGDRLGELRHTFTLDRKPIPPEIFADFGDDDLSDPGTSLRVTIDLLAAMGRTLYSGAVGTAPDGWVTQTRVTGGAATAGERTSYKFIGATRNDLLVVLVDYTFAGSGSYYTLHIMDAAPGHAFDSAGKLYDRLNLTVVRNIPLGDRWKGSIDIVADTITIVTEPGEPNNANGSRATQRFEAQRP
jgi:hypothetical protein